MKTEPGDSQLAKLKAGCICKRKPIAMLFTASFLMTIQAFATDLIWSGQAEDSDWFNANNWNPAFVPTEVDNVLIDHARVEIRSGTARFATLTVSSCGVLILDGGTLSGACTNLGTFEWSGGTVSGQMVVAPNAVLNFAGSNVKAINGVPHIGGALLNQGTMVVSGPGSIHCGNGGITNLAGGIFKVRTNVMLFGGVFANAGTVAVSDGILTLQTSLVSSGIFSVAPEKKVRLMGGNNHLTGTSVLAGEGGYELGSGNLNLNGAVVNATYGGGNSLTGNFTNTGTFQWSGGTVSGQMVVAPNAVLNFAGSNMKTVNGALLNQGTMVVSGPGSIYCGVNAGITNLAGGSFEVRTNVVVIGPGDFANAGTFRIASGTIQLWNNFVNPGLVWIQKSGVYGPVARFIVYGDYIQTAAGTLQMELSPAVPYSQPGLVINGHASFDGTFTMLGTEDYEPKGSNHFAMIGYHSFVGSFAMTNGLALDNGINLVMNYGSDLLSLAVTNLLPRFISSEVLSNGQFEFSLAVHPGQDYLIEASTNLSNWTFLTAFTGTNVFFQFTDVNATNHPIRFYRCLTQ